MIRFVDLYAGIGGFRLGLQGIDATCVFTSEINKFAQRTYRANFPGDVVGDIEPYADDPKTIPEHDLLTAGFPCQPFSIAGKRGGFRDSRSTAFHKLVAILEHHRPAAFLLENVSGLTWHDKGRTFEIMQWALMDLLGYELHAKVIDSRWWVPQHRKRIFLVGFREPTDFNFDELLIPDPPYPTLRTILETGDMSKFELSEAKWEIGKREWLKWTGYRTRCFTPDGVSYALCSYYGAHAQFAIIGDDAPPELQKYTLTKHAWLRVQRHMAKGHGHASKLCGFDDVSPTLRSNYQAGIHTLIPQRTKRPRKLAPRECARLMGFPDSFEIPVSDRQAYFQFGNAVVVPVVAAIAGLMEPHMKGNS